jgi:hypothetical protein
MKHPVSINQEFSIHHYKIIHSTLLLLDVCKDGLQSIFPLRALEASAHQMWRKLCHLGDFRAALRPAAPKPKRIPPK